MVFLCCQDLQKRLQLEKVSNEDKEKKMNITLQVSTCYRVECYSCESMGIL